jgi:HAD superfamily phosphatase (TIGR01668 family)
MIRRFCPELVVSRVTDLEPAFFAERGIRAAILDLDNTLVAWRGAEITPEIRGWVAAALRSGLKLCICSNTRRAHRLAILSKELGVPHIERVAKPRRAGFLKALALMEAQAAETVVIGDQLMTDIWGGNRCGLMTILVEPLSSVEFIGTRVVHRPLEALLLRRMGRMGLLRRWPPSPSGEAASEHD